MPSLITRSYIRRICRVNSIGRLSSRCDNPRPAIAPALFLRTAPPSRSSADAGKAEHVFHHFPARVAVVQLHEKGRGVHGGEDRRRAIREEPLPPRDLPQQRFVIVECEPGDDDHVDEEREQGGRHGPKRRIGEREMLAPRDQLPGALEIGRSWQRVMVVAPLVLESLFQREILEIESAYIDASFPRALDIPLDE